MTYDHSQLFYQILHIFLTFCALFSVSFCVPISFERQFKFQKINKYKILTRGLYPLSNSCLWLCFSSYCWVFRLLLRLMLCQTIFPIEKWLNICFLEPIFEFRPARQEFHNLKYLMHLPYLQISFKSSFIIIRKILLV